MTWRLGAFALACSIALLSEGVRRVSAWAAEELPQFQIGDSREDRVTPLRFQYPDETCRVRNRNGQIVRSTSRRRRFMILTGYPNGRPGYYVDHWIPLWCGGCDNVANLQWLNEAEWRAKTRWERERGCSSWRDGTFARYIQAGVDARAEVAR